MISVSPSRRAKAGLFFFYRPRASCLDFNATLTAVSSCFRGELSGICGRCFTPGVTKRGAPSFVWRDRAERFTPRLSGGNICVLANARRSLGRRGNRLPAAIRGGGPCHGPSEQRDGDEGEGRRGEVIPVSNPAAGTQRKSPVLKGLPKVPPACRSSSLDYTLAFSRPRMPLPALTDDTKN